MREFGSHGINRVTEQPTAGHMLLRAPTLPISPRAEQTMAMPAMRRRWTPEHVRRLIDESRAWPRYELIDGELLVTPAPGHPHQLAVGELHLLLAPYVEREGLGLTLLSPSDVELRPDTITQPDLYVLSAGPDEKLLLTIEVISPSSIRTDRVTKRDFYMESGVAEYWVVDLDARMVERWTPHQETPLVERSTLTWQPHGSASPLEIELSLLFDRVSLKSEIARKALDRR